MLTSSCKQSRLDRFAGRMKSDEVLKNQISNTFLLYSRLFCDATQSFQTDGKVDSDCFRLILMTSVEVHCISCGKHFKSSNAYRVFVDEKVEVPWSTPQHREYKGGEPIYVCSKKCYEDFKKNMKEFWHPEGEY